MTNHTDTPEVLAPALSKAEARPLITTTKRHLQRSEGNMLSVYVDLRRLFDGGAHLTYDFDEFGSWAADTFDELSAESARKYIQYGFILQQLADSGRISLDGRAKPLVGTTAVRALQSVHKVYSIDDVLAVHDAARRKHGPKKLSGADIVAARKQLLPAAKPATELAPTPAELEAPVRAPYQPDPEETASGPDLVGDLQDIAVSLRDLVADGDWESVDASVAQATLQELAKQVDRARKLIVPSGEGLDPE